MTPRMPRVSNADPRSPARKYLMQATLTRVTGVSIITARATYTAAAADHESGCSHRAATPYVINAVLTYPVTVNARSIMATAGA
jgi:hypothetical protein